MAWLPSQHVLYTDEASFTREGVFHSYNSHFWVFENPHAQFVGRYQHRFSVNVWAGIVHKHLLGPYLLLNTLHGCNYFVFLPDILPQLLEDIPLNIRERIWFQHDGAPPHLIDVLGTICKLHFPIVGLAGEERYHGHLDHQTLLPWIYFCGEKLNVLCMRQLS